MGKKPKLTVEEKRRRAIERRIQRQNVVIDAHEEHLRVTTRQKCGGGFRVFRKKIGGV